MSAQPKQAKPTLLHCTITVYIVLILTCSVHSCPDQASIKQLSHEGETYLDYNTNIYTLCMCQCAQTK